MSQRQNPPKLNLDQVRTQLQQCHALAPTRINRSISPQEQTGHKDFRGIWYNPSEVLPYLSGEIPLGDYGHGGRPSIEISPTPDLRRQRHLVSAPLKEMQKGHALLVGPTGAGKTELMSKLVVNLHLSYSYTVIWMSTKWEDDRQFAELIAPDYTAISVENKALTRFKGGRFNPLSRISVDSRTGWVDPQRCDAIAQYLAKCLPIKDISGDTEKFLRDAESRLAALIEVVKYVHGDRAQVSHLLPLWTILAAEDDEEHPLKEILDSEKIHHRARPRLERDLALLLRRQSESEAMLGPTANQLLSQLRALDPVLSGNDISDFGAFRRSHHPNFVLVDQSDGLGARSSQAISRLLFPLLYEELVKRTPSDWQAQGYHPVVIVADEMGSLMNEELGDFLDKARSKGVYLIMGQQASGQEDRRLTAAISNNTRVQVLFSGCDTNDPRVKDFQAVAGKTRPLVSHDRPEPGFASHENLPVDAIASLGAYACLVRCKFSEFERILWLNQNNPLVGKRRLLRQLREQLATEIVGGEGEYLKELLDLHFWAEALLLRSYGYWEPHTLNQAYHDLDWQGLAQAYQTTCSAIASQEQKTRDQQALDNSKAEWLRNEGQTLARMTLEQQYQSYVKTEEWAWNYYVQHFLPKFQRQAFYRRGDPIHRPGGLFRMIQPEDFGYHVQAVLSTYYFYLSSLKEINPTLWEGIEPLVRRRVGHQESFKPTLLARLKKRINNLFAGLLS